MFHPTFVCQLHSFVSLARTEGWSLSVPAPCWDPASGWPWERLPRASSARPCTPCPPPAKRPRSQLPSQLLGHRWLLLGTLCPVLGGQLGVIGVPFPVGCLCWVLEPPAAPHCLGWAPCPPRREFLGVKAAA